MLRTLDTLGYVVQDNLAKRWRLAVAVFLAHRTGLWRRDPRYQGRSFYEFILRQTGIESRMKIWRLRILGEHYSQQDYLELVRKGVGLTGMTEIYRADRRLWTILRKALEGGATIQQLALMRAKGERMLARQDQEDLLTPEEREAELEETLLKEGAREKKRGARASALANRNQRKNGERGTGGAGADEDGRGGDSEEDQQHLQEERDSARRARAQAEAEQQAAAAARAELLAQRQAAAAAQAEVEAQRQAAAAAQAELEQARARLAGEDARIAAAEARLAAEQRGLLTLQAQLATAQAELDAQAAALRQREAHLDERDQLRQEPVGEDFAAAIEQRWLEAQAALAELAEQRAGLAAQQQALGERERALGAQELALGERELALGAQEHGLAERQSALDARAQQLADREAALAAQGQRLQAEGAAQQQALEAQKQALADQAAAYQEALDQLGVHKQALDAQRTELEEKKQALDALACDLAEKKDDLDQAQIELNNQRRQVLDMLKEVQQEEADLTDERARVELLQIHAEATIDRLIDERKCNNAAYRRLQQAEFSIAHMMRSERGLVWPEEPISTDGTLMCIADHISQAVYLIRDVREEILGRRDIPEKGLPIMLLMDQAYRALEEVLPPAVEAISQLCLKADPFSAETFLTAYHLDPVAAINRELGRKPVMPRKLRAGLLFRMPIRALLGNEESDTPQQGVLGATEDGQELVTIDMNQPQAVVVTGQIGYGKTNTLGVLIENAQKAKENLCNTQVEYLVSMMHYDAELNGPAPRWHNYFLPNDEPEGVKTLRTLFGAEPQPMTARRKIVIVPDLDEELMAQRRIEHAGMELRVLKLGRRRINRNTLRLIMGTHKQAPLYMARIGYAIEQVKGDNPQAMLAAIRALTFKGEVKDIVEARLVLLERLLGAEDALADLGPGDFVGVDLRAPYLDEAQAMCIFSIVADALSNAKTRVERNGQMVEERFMKFIVFDEAHKYMGRGEITRDILVLLRELRHRRTWVVFACQDPDTLHPTIIQLSTVQIVHQTKSEASLRYLAKHCAGFAELTVQELAALDRGWAYVLTTTCANRLYRQKPQKSRIRPTAAKPSGTTQTALPPS